MTRTRHIKRSRRRADIWPRLWRRHPIAATVVLAVVLAAVAWDRFGRPAGADGRNPGPRAVAGADHDRYHNKVFTCVKVVDGDTIDINTPDGKYDTTRIRLWGVDTPETGKGGRARMYFGQEAMEFTQSLVLNNPVRVVLAREKTREKYSRLLAYVYVGDGDLMLNEELIINGCAYADHRFDHPWQTRFLDLEKRARKQQVGLWKEVTPEQMPEWRQRYDQWREKKAG